MPVLFSKVLSGGQTKIEMFSNASRNAVYNQSRGDWVQLGHNHSPRNGEAKGQGFWFSGDSVLTLNLNQRDDILFTSICDSV